MHEYYEPTEYEQQLIAANMISAADVDLEYQEYLKKADADYAMDYRQWQSTRRYLDELNDQYKTKIEPLYMRDNYHLTYAEQTDADALMRRMNDCEIALGY